MLRDNDNVLTAFGVTSGILAILGYFSAKTLSKVHSEEKYLRNLRVYSPDEIKDIIERNDPLMQKLFKRSDDGNHLVGRNMMIQGYLSNDSCLDSQITKGKHLVARLNYNYPYYNDKEQYSILSEKRLQSQSFLNRFYERKNVQTTISPTLILSNNGVSCVALISKEFNTIDKECFDHVDSKMLKNNTSIMKEAWNKVGLGLAGFIAFLVKRIDVKDLLCFQVKVDNCEIGIRNGGVLSILGDVVLDTTSMEMTVPRPLRLMKNKIESLQLLNIKAEKYFDRTLICWMFSGTSAICALILLYKQLQNKDYIKIFGFRVKISERIVNTMRRISKFIQRKKLDLPSPYQPPTSGNRHIKYLESVYTHPREDMECIICYGQCRSVIIRPCQHCSMCQMCYAQLQKRECPVCKTPIIGQVVFATDREQQAQPNGSNASQNQQLPNGSNLSLQNSQLQSSSNRQIHNSRARHHQENQQQV